jgi:hypothetical protein
MKDLSGSMKTEGLISSSHFTSERGEKEPRQPYGDPIRSADNKKIYHRPTLTKYERLFEPGMGAN